MPAGVSDRLVLARFFYNSYSIIPAVDIYSLHTSQAFPCKLRFRMA